MGLRGYLIHGTNKPWTIGKRRSHGCIRMRRSDVEELFDKVSVGTSVRIISQASPLAQLPKLPKKAIIAKAQSEKQSYEHKTYRKKNQVISRPMTVEIDPPVKKIFTDNSLFTTTQSANHKRKATKFQSDFIAEQRITDEKKNNIALGNLFKQLSNNGANTDSLPINSAPINDAFFKAINTALEN